MPNDATNILYPFLIALLDFSALFLLIVYGWSTMRRWLKRQEAHYDLVLNHDLLLEVPPRIAMATTASAGVALGTLIALTFKSGVFFPIGPILTIFGVPVVFNYLHEKRRQKLDEQVVDGVTALASGVRAGLTLIQAMQLLVKNRTGPIKQEFQQMLHEYDLGIDLHAAMINTSNRIGSSYYRLLFAALQAHRQRGGDMGQSLDRISDSIREIQRLEGRLESLTSQGRAQARFMAVMPVVILVILMGIFPEETSMLFNEPVGRLILLATAGLITLSFLWIRKIMEVDI